MDVLLRPEDVIDALAKSLKRFRDEFYHDANWSHSPDRPDVWKQSEAALAMAADWQGRHEAHLTSGLEGIGRGLVDAVEGVGQSVHAAIHGLDKATE